MPLRVIATNAIGDVKLEQYAIRPLVYLDTWALNLFAYEDKNLGERFVQLLRKKDGTLVLTYIHMYEVCKRDDIFQVNQILNFIDSINCAFLLANPSEVIRREKLLKRRDISYGNSPWADFSLIKSLFISGHPEDIKNFSLIFSELKEELLKGGKLESPFEKSMIPFVERARKDLQALKKVKSRLKKIKERILEERPYTEEIYKKVMDYIVGNENMKMKDNDWRDIFPLIVAVSYCDFVLIDRRWVRFIENTGLTYPNIAKVYYKTHVDDFLLNLKNYEYGGKNPEL